MIVLDTHAWLWWCADRDRLKAKTIAALGRQRELFVSAISAWELCMLVRKGRLTFKGRDSTGAGSASRSNWAR